MKCLHILYLYMGEVESIVLKVLSTRCSVQLCRAGEENGLQKDGWDLVVLQDAVYCLLQTSFCHKLKKYPWLFVSTRPDIRGYMAPATNLFGVVNLSGINLSLWGIPKELQVRLDYPVEKVADWYFYEQQPEVCRIAYCPTGNSVQENDFKLISFVQKTNAFLTIVSDRYRALANAFPPFVRVVPEKDGLAVFKKSHLVVASGQDAVCALAVCKPCVVLGDCGLGGLVTPANYEQLQSVSFSGRKGGCPGEFVPIDLLETEIRTVFSSDCKEEMLALRKKVLAVYGMDCFSTSLTGEVERITALSARLKSRKGRFELKPFRSSVFRVEELDGKMYIMRGLQCLGEIEDEMAGSLKQCDGTVTVSDLIGRNGFEPEDVVILWENLYALWKEKLILFAL